MAHWDFHIPLTEISMDEIQGFWSGRTVDALITIKDHIKGAENQVRTSASVKLPAQRKISRSPSHRMKETHTHLDKSLISSLPGRTLIHHT